MLRVKSIAAVVAAVMLALPASAATINGATSGVVGAETNVGFGELVTVGAITDQYEDQFGVTFTPGLTRLNNNPNRANFTSPYLGNFGGANPFSILFTDAASDASFAMTSNGGISTTFTALLQGTVVEEFVTNVTQPSNANTNNFYGFADSLFDEIRISVGGNGNSSIVGLDTLAFNTAVAAVPLPASLPLLFASLGGLAWLRRRRNATHV